MGKYNPVREEIKENLSEYKKVLGDLYGGDVCFHCILKALWSYSVAVVYDSMAPETSEKMSKEWDSIEKECDRAATYFIDHAQSED